VPYARRRGTCKRSLAGPPEDAKKLFLRFLGDPFLAKRAARLDRLAHLPEVGCAALAENKVLLESRPVLDRHRVLEELGDQPDHLGAGQFVGHAAGHGAFPSAKCFSSTARTFDRARWSRTRWFPSEIPSDSQASSELQPST